MITSLVVAGNDAAERVTLAMPHDLAQFVLTLPEVQARLGEIGIDREL